MMDVETMRQAEKNSYKSSINYKCFECIAKIFVLLMCWDTGYVFISAKNICYENISIVTVSPNWCCFVRDTIISYINEYHRYNPNHTLVDWKTENCGHGVLGPGTGVWFNASQLYLMSSTVQWSSRIVCMCFLNPTSLLQCHNWGLMCNLDPTAFLTSLLVFIRPQIYHFHCSYCTHWYCSGWLTVATHLDASLYIWCVICP